MGNETTASGYASTAMGYYTTAEGKYSTAMGDGTKATGDYSTAMGIIPLLKPMGKSLLECIILH